MLNKGICIKIGGISEGYEKQAISKHATPAIEGHWKGPVMRQKRMGISRGTDPQGQWQNAFSGHPAGFFDAMAITAGTNKSRTQGKP